MSEQFPENLPEPHPMYNQPLIPAGKIYDALVEFRGNKAAVCRELGIRRRILDERISRNADLQELLSDMREEVIDNAESNMFVRAESGADPAAEKFILQTIGRNRGYSTAISGNGANGDIVVTIRRFGDEE